ncbi:radical SAM protein [Eubacterium oxidoreducens]|uniref:FeMo cofactor biosynthesis protein NifB n=1 Tax=Eubacterium oxidoreducens TaxID=1732 RepID=A0A1G6C286_EUBOX|nr:radical SAM protein [Eubacterium oxidoreducens]SDB26967.1 nitrogen fixation protein NifB [Eubacterium oxidoreducens]
MSVSFEELKSRHPCFALGEKSNNGRIHLPVSPGCNIGCHFCKRDYNITEERPGVASGIISPQEALETVKRAVKIMPQIQVVGVAGPGDTLATPYALDTFELIKKEFPDMIKCMSTNGLMLKELADRVIEVGIDSLTVTVNAVDPKIQARINEYIIWHGKRYEGEEAAKILIENQLEGIRKVTESNVTVKVNTVLIPQINKDHIETIAKTVSQHGASIYNIIPLIPQHHLDWCTEPGCEELYEARREAEKYIKVFRHCQRCRADAVGVPGGKDISKQIYLKEIKVKQTFSHG